MTPRSRRLIAARRIMDNFADFCSHTRLGDAARAFGVAKLAKALGMSTPTIYNWLSGKEPISLENRIRAARVLGYRVGHGASRAPQTRPTGKG